jgi:hypothetical protein
VASEKTKIVNTALNMLRQLMPAKRVPGVQEPTAKRCRIVEERPAPGVGVVIGGVRTEAETRMRTECRETTGSGGDTVIQERKRPVERPAR